MCVCVSAHLAYLINAPIHYITRPAYPKILLSVVQTAYIRIFRFLTIFLADTPPISQNETVSNVNFFFIIHLVRTVCELTSSIIQMHYTQSQMTLFCLHLRKSFSIEDSRTRAWNCSWKKKEKISRGVRGACHSPPGKF